LTDHSPGCQRSLALQFARRSKEMTRKELRAAALSEVDGSDEVASLCGSPAASHTRCEAWFGHQTTRYSHRGRSDRNLGTCSVAITEAAKRLTSHWMMWTMGSCRISRWTNGVSHVEEGSDWPGWRWRYGVGRSCRPRGLLLRLTFGASAGMLWNSERHYLKARQECRTGANSRDNRTYAQYVLHDEIA